MKRNRIVLAASLASITLVGTVTQSTAAGFKVGEQGAKPMAMANAFAAQADDPSALAYNPAGIAFQKGTQFQLGTTTILVPQTEFEGTTRLSSTPVSERANRDIFIAPTLYLTSSMDSLPLSFGLGVNSFNPLAKRWDAGSAFRDSIQEIAIKPINFQPTVAYRLDDLKLAVAAGFDVTYAQVSLQKMVYGPVPPPVNNPYGQYGTLGADATAVGYGYNFGLKWNPLDNVSLGAAYRSKVRLDLEGDANFMPGTYGGSIGYQKTTASTDVTLPDSFTIGLAYKPTDKLTLEFDAEWTGWSSYDELVLKFGAPLAAFSNKPNPKNWKDVWAYRLGAQYAVSPMLDLRAGYAYDCSPTPDSTLSPELPDSDRHNVSIGTGLHNQFGSVDLAYMWVHWIDRSVNSSSNLNGISGTFKSDAHLLAASVTLKF